MTKKEIILIFILVTIGIVRFLFFIPKPPNFENVVGRQVEFVGIVKDNPDRRINNQHLIIYIEEQKSNILVTVSREIDVFYGDKVKIKGELETPESFLTNIGKEFNYKRYLANQNIYYVIQNADIQIISHGNGNVVKSILFKLKNSFTQNIEKVIVSPESNLAGGLLVGERGGFDNKMREKFIETGTIHIVALSGYNISVISDNVIIFFSLFLSSIYSTLLGFVIIILFIIMTGATGTAIRAAIMASILLLAKITGRKYLAGRALVIAALLMLAYDPRIITDMSFELSFLATGGLIFILPKIINWFKFLPTKFKIRETVATTFSATTAVLPLLLYSTGVFSLVSLPVNLLILPVLPITMFFGFLTGFLGYISPVLSMPFAFISKILLSYILIIINFFSAFSLASFSFQSFPIIIAIILYLFMFYWVFSKDKN